MQFESFQIIKMYTETNELVDEKAMTKEPCYTAQQNSPGLKTPKVCIRECNKHEKFGVHFWGFYIFRILLDYVKTSF